MYCNSEVAQPPGYDTRKLSNQSKGKLLWFVSKSLKNNLHSQFPDIVTRVCATFALYNLQILLPGNRYKKNLLSWISPWKQNILGVYSRAYVLFFHEKNQTSKISCYCPFKKPVAISAANNTPRYFPCGIPQGSHHKPHWSGASGRTATPAGLLNFNQIKLLWGATSALKKSFFINV